MVSWGAGIKAKDINRLNKLIRKAASVVSSKLVTLEEVAEGRMLDILLVIMDIVSQPPTKLWTSFRAASAFYFIYLNILSYSCKCLSILLSIYKAVVSN